MGKVGRKKVGGDLPDPLGIDPLGSEKDWCNIESGCTEER